ncbi:unnamed protein product, partial [Discosporangium mesarthrocarpum]
MEKNPVIVKDSLNDVSVPSVEELRRQVARFLKASADPYKLTFKQVRLGIEKEMGLPEHSLSVKARAIIKAAVHSVLDEMEEVVVAGEGLEGASQGE